MIEIKVNLKKNSYPLKIGYGILKKTGFYVSRMKLGKDAVIITNCKIWRLYGAALKRSLVQRGINCSAEMIPDTESSKSDKIFFKVINRMIRRDKGKKPFIIALGGGVVGDLAGFVAAVYRRGVPIVQIPTTLLAQVDSSIGGKVAIDTPFAKNLVGTFYQPRMVIADASVLLTLPKREIQNGLSEVIKYSVINSASFFDFVEKNIMDLKKLERKKITYVIRKCCNIKAGIVSSDEKDVKGIRAVLNYGHTVGHAIEAAAGYGGRYNHGEAIAIGMVAEAEMANKLGRLSSKDVSRIKSLVKKAGLPDRIKGLVFFKIWNAHIYDKKFTRGVNAFALPEKIGKVSIVKNVPNDMIKAVVKSLMA